MDAKVAGLLALGEDSEEEDADLSEVAPLLKGPDTGVEEAKGNAEEEDQIDQGEDIGIDQVDTKIVTRHQGLGDSALAAAFPERSLSLASDKFREAWSCVQADQWDIKSWQTMLSEAQMQRSGRGISLPDVYRLCLKQFPTTVRFWKELADYELRQGNLEVVDEILMQCLLDCPSVELWQLYISRIRKGCPAGDGSGSSREEVEEHRSNMVNAYEFALVQIGIAVDSAPLWWEYISFVKGWKEEAAGLQGDTIKITTLRRIYQRAVAVPLDSLDDMWRSYEAWERNLNEHNAKQVLPTLQGIFTNAKNVARDRKQLVDQVKTNRIPVPPQGTDEEREQLNLLRRRIDFEKANPEHVDPPALKDRVRLAYRSSLGYFYRFPEVWQEFAEYELETGDVDAAASLYERGLEAIPDCVILHIAYAELEEKRGKAEHGAEVLKALVLREPSTLGYIYYQTYVRRNQGKAQAREVFRSTKELRKKGILTYHYYLAHARMEQHVNQEVETARRVLEYGLRQHPEFVQEVEYVCAFTDLLAQLHDEKNLRGLYDRALAALGTSDKAKPLWRRLLAYEVVMASDQDAKRIEQVQARIEKAYPHEKQQQSILRLWKRYSVFGVKPTTEADEMLMSRYKVDVEADLGIETRLPTRDRDLDGIDDAGIMPALPDGNGRGGGRRDDRGMGRGRRDDGVLAAIQQRRLQGIPEYLRSLYVVLPPHTGPPPDVDTIIRSLRDHPMPTKPAGTAPPPKQFDPPPVPPPAAPQASAGVGAGKRKRRWGADKGEGDDSDDDGGRLMQGASNDVFRSRQQDKVMRGQS